MTRLGNTFGHHQVANVTLIDRSHAMKLPFTRYGFLTIGSRHMQSLRWAF